MNSFRTLTTVALSIVASVLVTPARPVVAQQRPGIRAQVTPPEGCSITSSVDTEDMFSFTYAQIKALGFAQAGDRASHKTSASGSGTLLSETPDFVGLRQERIYNTCAGFVLSPYTSSKDEGVATVAKYMVFAFEELGKMSDEMLGISMRAGFPDNNAGPTARLQLSDWSGRRQKILRNMTDAVNLSLSLLIRTNAEGQPTNMILTHEQRNSLLGFLDFKFPSLGDREKVEHSGDFVKQAALIRSFLAGNDRSDN